MMRLTIFSIYAILFALGSPSAGAEAVPSGHNHDAAEFSAGEPGDANTPSRIIQVTMQERNTKMLFVPNRVEIRKGEQISFVLHNTGNSTTNSYLRPLKRI